MLKILNFESFSKIMENSNSQFSFLLELSPHSPSQKLNEKKTEKLVSKKSNVKINARFKIPMVILIRTDMHFAFFEII